QDCRLQSATRVLYGQALAVKRRIDRQWLIGSDFLATEYIVRKRTYAVMLAIAMLALGPGVGVNAQGNNQKADTQQQASQQKQSASKAGSDQSPNQQENNHSQAEDGKKIVGQAGRSYLMPAQMPS